LKKEDFMVRIFNSLKLNYVDVFSTRVFFLQIGGARLWINPKFIEDPYIIKFPIRGADIYKLDDNNYKICNGYDDQMLMIVETDIEDKFLESQYENRSEIVGDIHKYSIIRTKTNFLLKFVTKDEYVYIAPSTSESNPFEVHVSKYYIPVEYGVKKDVVDY
jgi:hypothetical protein